MNVHPFPEIVASSPRTGAGRRREPPSGATSTPFSAASVPQRLAGDLDSIVLKALRKNPAERYWSAGALGDDVTRYLTGLPLAARDDGWLYRLAKFITRHRSGVIAAALVLVSLVGGLAAARSQAREAERHFTKSERSRARRSSRVQDSIENVPGVLATA